MNDDDLMTAVRDRFAPVLMETPAAEIIKRGRGLRRRRHGGKLAAGALAVSLGAGLAVPALTAGGAAAPQRATLAAWTIQQHPDGTIAVTIRRPENLAALQRKLAAFGVLVTFVDGRATPVTGCELLIQLRKRAPHETFAIQIRPAEFREARIALRDKGKSRAIWSQGAGARPVLFKIAVAQCAVAIQR
jgi:hypothetical protein